MKKILLLLSLACLLNSCVSSYYQICKVSSDLPTTSKGNYVSENESCKIIYDFWGAGGSIYFAMYNKTDEILYVNLEKSFLIKNGIAYDYFKNRSSATTDTKIVSKSVSVKDASWGYWSYYGLNVPGSFSVTKANAIQTQKSSTVEFGEKPIVAIPPHSSKILYEYKIMQQHFTDCDLYESPSKRERPSMTFESENSPVCFSNYISYSIGEGDIQTVENSFYISEVTNQNEKATVVKTAVGCDSDYKKNIENVFLGVSPRAFYVEYTPREQIKRKTKKAQTTNMDDIYRR